jgi:hypothetical protein
LEYQIPEAEQVRQDVRNLAERLTEAENTAVTAYGKYFDQAVD